MKQMTKEKTVQKEEMADRLYEIRKRHGLTQEKFSEKLGISLSAYKKLENGTNRISIDTLYELEGYQYGAVEYVLFGYREKPEEVWTIIRNCSEEEKIRLLLRLSIYFTETRLGGDEELAGQNGYKKLIDNFFEYLQRKWSDAEYSYTWR